MTKSEKEIDNLLKNSFTLTNEEKEKYSKEVLTDEEIEKLKTIMVKPEDNSVNVENDFVVETNLALPQRGIPSLDGSHLECPKCGHKWK